MSIQLGVGPHSTSSLIRSNSSFEVDSIQLNNITSTNSLNSNSINTTNINVINDINITGILNITNDLNITSGTVNLVNSNLILDSNSTFAVNGDFDVNNLNVINDLTANNLTITGNSILKGDLNVSESLYVNNNKVGINIDTPSESLHISGSSKITSNLSVGGSMVIGGEDNFNDTNFEDFSKWGSGNDIDTQIYSKYEYVGIGTEDPQYFLDVSGIINTRDRYFINGNEVLSNNSLSIGVTSSNLEELGLLKSLNITGESNFNNQLKITSNINITGNINKYGNLNTNGDLNITGDINLNGNLIVSDVFNLNNTKLDITEKTNILNNNFKIQNRIIDVIKKLPPNRLTGNTQIFNSEYSNGEYNLSTSSLDNSIFLYQSMDGYTDTFFRSDKLYNSITGLYTGSTNFKNLGILGEWVQINLPQQYELKSMVIKVINSFIDGKNPKEIVIYGSTDNISWNHIQTFDNLLWDINESIFSYRNFTINNTNLYKYYTFIIPKVGGRDLSGSYINSDSFILGELELYFNIEEYEYINMYSDDNYLGVGTTNPRYNLDVKGDINIDGKFLIESNEIFNTSLLSNLREYPSTNLNIKSLKINTSSETIELGTVDEDFATTYGFGDYEIYYSGFSPFFFPNSIGSNLFNKVINENIYYRTQETYDINGEYIGNSSLSGFMGEYIIIKLPVNILIKAFRIYNNLYDSEYFSPRKYKILGSLNKVTWDLLFEKDNEYFNSTNDYNYIENNVFTDSLYNYFAIVVNKVGNYDVNYNINTRGLKIQEFKIYGVEYNKYGVNYDTGIYINGPLRVNGELDVANITIDTAQINTIQTDLIQTNSINVSTSIKLPVGDTSQRVDVTGSIRFNEEIQQFEGFSGTWGSLGGIKDVDQDTYISAETNPGDDNDELKFYTSGTERMIIDSIGNLGLGTNPTNGKIEIDGDFGSTLLTNYGELTQSGFGLGDSGTQSFSIYANGKIAASEFNAISDKRVKKILNEREIDKDLEYFEKVKIYDFKYIDKKLYSSRTKIGFMAQELEEYNKNLVNYSINFIPNVFKQFNVKTQNKQHIIELDKDYDIEINDVLKVQMVLGSEIKTKELVITEKINKIIYLSYSKNLSNLSRVFIYGKLVKDFRTVNWEQLIAINTNIIKNLKNENDELKEKVSNNELQIQYLIERLNKLENPIQEEYIQNQNYNFYT